eukprot:1147886-Pelagomonas_calceolata.AAC.2
MMIQLVRNSPTPIYLYKVKSHTGIADPRGFQDEQRLTPSRPDAILAVPMKTTPRIDFQYYWSVVLDEEYRGAQREQESPCASHSHSTYFQGVDWVIYTPHTLEPLREIIIDTHRATKLALKIHANSVQYAYKLASTNRALEKSSFNLHQRRYVASKLPDP